MPKYRVLAFDGGGIRGYLTTLLLEKLLQAAPELETAFDSVDLFAGNSSGSLIALAMAHGLEQPTMAQTLALTRQAFENGRELFGSAAPVFGRWAEPKYQTETRERALKKLLGETSLGGLPRHVLVTTFDLDNESPDPNNRRWKPKIFHNLPGPTDLANSDRDLPAWKVALYSTAAITYFPRVDGYIDGGLYANNPSVCALAQVFDDRYEPSAKPARSDVLLLSIGAGQTLTYEKGDTDTWGITQWAWDGRYVDLVTDGTVGIANYECRQLLGESNYRRLAPDFDPGVEVRLDDLDAIGRMRRHVESDQVQHQIEECAAWMKQNWIDKPAPRIFPSVTTSKHVGTATELACLMTIKPGFLPVLDTRTYATRLRILFRVLQALRVATREIRVKRPILDIVDAARTVQSFTWTIIKERFLLLNVTFDRPWEPYIRVIWRDLGPLLDLILCNCEGFVPSTESHERFAEFVRAHQIETGFFYPASSLTVDDQFYLENLERVQREGSENPERIAATVINPSPEANVARFRRRPRRLARGGYGGRGSELDPEWVDQWSSVLNALYGLRNVYPEPSPDNDILRRAAIKLLDPPPENPPESPALTWLNSAEKVRDQKPQDEQRTTAAQPVDRLREDKHRHFEPSVVQGGILKGYRDVSHGCMLLATVDDPAEARRLIRKCARFVTRANHEASGDRLNLSFTPNGLRRLGVAESDLAQFPQEFREGMEARAGLLGDVRQNHPEVWTPPEWNVRFQVENGKPTADFVDERPADGTSSGDLHPTAKWNVPRVRLSSVDIVIVLHDGLCSDEHDWHSHPVQRKARRLCVVAKKHGIRVLSLQPLHRLSRAPEGQSARTDSEQQNGKKEPEAHDHFGFTDGLSQPKPVDHPKSSNEVPMGECFVGFRNQRGDRAFPPERQGSLIDAGSFLVVRKLRQDVRALWKMAENARLKTPELEPETLLAKMMGRFRNGAPLVEPPPQGNGKAFTFNDDTHGSLCPFHSHIRRTNPRLNGEANGSRAALVPRILRRSLAYGPPFRNDDADRGMMFMAFNASIAEQFEVIQRWISGGNTPGDNGTTTFSGQPDPILGLPDADGKRIYQFVDGDEVRRVDLGPTPLVTLQWGLYLFAPSIPGLREIARDPRPDATKEQALVGAGLSILPNLTTRDDWATVLEDVSATQGGATAAVLAAIQATRGGVMRTPYGVLVASEELAMEVLHSDPDFSVREYQHRFRSSVGESYLGIDRGKEYDAASEGPNKALELITESEAFELALVVTRQIFPKFLEASPKTIDGLIIAPLDRLISLALGELARVWFDIPDGKHILPGEPPVSDPAGRAPHCPFDFLAPSRFVFSSPNPRAIVRDLGERSGQSLLDAVSNLVSERRSAKVGYEGKIAKALAELTSDNDDLLARELLGLVFGFVPTVYGSALQVLSLWLGDDTLWRVQQNLRAATDEGAVADPVPAEYENAKSVIRGPLERGMHVRPVPSLLYRTVTVDRQLGPVSLVRGDRVVLCMAAVTQGTLRRGGDDVPMFGGRRGKAGAPTHACPGREIAMGVLMGILYGILEQPTLLSSPSMFTVRIPERDVSAAGKTPFNVDLAHADFGFRK